MITLGALNDISGLRHGFFTRAGGVSTGIYQSLNCGLGSRDSREAVIENRARAMARFDLPADRLVTVSQVHSPRVVVVDRPWAADQSPEADGLVTARAGIALGILSADCVPILFADTKIKVIGAAHAGWRGALGGVIEATVREMVALGAKPVRMVAALGPCIAQRSYEVGPNFPAQFLAEQATNSDFFAPSRRAGHFMFDLAGYVARKIGSCEVSMIQRCPNDTFAEDKRFFSYRRTTLRGEPDYGRGLTAIAVLE